MLGAVYVPDDQGLVVDPATGELQAAVADITTLGSVKIDPVGGLEMNGDLLGHVSNAIPPGVMSGITYDDHGHIIGAVRLVSTDLPPATDAEIGAISVPASSGLTVDADGAIAHANADPTGGATISGITLDSTGHVADLQPLAGTDLPLATDTTIGGVSVQGPGIEVDGSGALSHSDSGVTPQAYAKVTVDEKGHVVAGSDLLESDIPDLPADRITSGTFPSALLADRSVTQLKMADEASMLIKDELTAAEQNPDTSNWHKGLLWFREDTGELHVWNGNSWMPVGAFGRLQDQNLRFGGTFDASTGAITDVTAIGNLEGCTKGDPIPAAAPSRAGMYLVADNPGTQSGVTYDAGDWMLCIGTDEANITWRKIDVIGATGGGGGGVVGGLDGLVDVSIATTPNSGDQLTFTGGTWTNVPAPKELPDAAASNPGDVLTFESPAVGWVPKPVDVLPSRTIIMWHGDIKNPPAGWLVCDGTNGTPNLSGMFIVGATDGAPYPLGATGGAASVSLTAGQMPSHAHSITDKAHNHGINQTPHGHGVSDPGHSHAYNIRAKTFRATETVSNGEHWKQVGVARTSHEPTRIGIHGQNANVSNRAAVTGITGTNAAGSGQPHENRPPYFALVYLMKQ